MLFESLPVDHQKKHGRILTDRWHVEMDVDITRQLEQCTWNIWEQQNATNHVFLFILFVY